MFKHMAYSPQQQYIYCLFIKQFINIRPCTAQFCSEPSNGPFPFTQFHFYTMTDV